MSRATLLVVFAAVAVLWGACGEAAPAEPGAGTPAALDGRALYLATCAACHGNDLKGTFQGPPFLDSIYQPSHHGDAAFLVAVRSGVRPHHWNFGAMPPLPGLTDAQVAAIVAFVRAQQRAAGIR